jgi:hypothetical protein
MKDKYKLWVTAILLVVVLMLLVSTMLKITPKKISNLFTKKDTIQTDYNDTTPEQMIHDENSLPDEPTPDELKKETKSLDDQVDMDSAIAENA